MNKRINFVLAGFAILLVFAILIRWGASSSRTAAPPAADAASQDPWPTATTPPPAVQTAPPQWSTTSKEPPAVEPTPTFQPASGGPGQATPAPPAAAPPADDQAPSAKKADSTSSNDWLHMYAIPSGDQVPPDTAQASQAPQETAAQRLARKLRHH